MLDLGSRVARKLDAQSPTLQEQLLQQAQTRPSEEPNYGFLGWKGAQVAIPKYGEQKTGRLSNSPIRKRIRFETDQQLSDWIWDHFYHGEGQPVEIDLGKLDFSQNVNIPNLISEPARAVLLSAKNLQDPVIKQFMQNHLHHILEKPVSIAGNGKVTHVDIQQPFTGVRLDIPLLTPKGAVFGRMPMTIKNTELLINHEAKTVTVMAELYARDTDINLLDDFDFDPQIEKFLRREEGARSLLGEVLTNAVHYGAKPGSTRFKLYAVNGTYSKFRRVYTFDDFWR